MWLFKRTSDVVKSYAKINLSLRVLGPAPNGYHNLEMVTLPIGLHDVIEISINDTSPNTHVICDDIGLSNVHHNLCMKAVDAMRSKFGFKNTFDISIHKNIPFAAGLGGGSSNAASVMRSLVSLLGLKATEDELIQVAASIGADVPFFLKMKPALVAGIGEIVTPLDIHVPYHCLIVKPKEGLSTKSVFAESDNFEPLPIDSSKVIEALKIGDDDLLASCIGNDLYAPARFLLPKIESIVEELKSLDLPISAMSGSGSSCFALSKDVKKLKFAASKMSAQGYFAAVTNILS